MLGRYQHYKGGKYHVIGSAKHTETEEDLVLYVDESGKLWARPYEMFFGKVEVDGVQANRFFLINE